MKFIYITLLSLTYVLTFLIGCKMVDKKPDTNCNELDEYILMLEEENQILGSMLAECE